jgi:hypothetical protein
MSYVYLMSETAAETGDYPLYTVGFYNPAGRFIPESDHGLEGGKESAAARVAYLNGEGRPRPKRNGHLCGAKTKAECECRPQDPETGVPY